MNKFVSKKTLSIFLRPFRKHLLFFIVFCFLLSCCYIIGSPTRSAAIVMMMHCFCVSYFISLCVGLIRNNLCRYIAQSLFIALAAFDFVLNFYCVFQLHYVFDSDIALLLLETDLNETKEFFATMLPLWMVLTVICLFTSLIVICLFLRYRNVNLNLGKRTSFIAMGLIAVFFMVNIYHWKVWKIGPIAPFYELARHDNPLDLKSFYTHPHFRFDNNELPINVVLIIGESFARNHSSVYGYDKLTNPCLMSLKSDSLLFSFDSISSPASTTAKSLRDMLSTYNISSQKNDRKWYEYTTLIEIMKECGYDSYWFGNQARANRWNVTSRLYAQACDHQWFLQREGTDDVGDHIYDIVLVDSSYKYVNQLRNQNHHLFIYHMMGSHFDFSKRYPREYAKFSENDYPTNPKNHRVILSSYDNSIFYNDYIVKRIIDLFKDSESIVIYLPDHGQVMYRNRKDPDFYAHGREKDPIDYALGVEIPFFMYTSPLFQQKHPITIDRIKYRQDNPKRWNSENLPYLIMDLIGIKEINGESVCDKSILN